MSLEADTFNVVLDEPFFAPVASDIFAALVGQYQHMRTRIEQLADLVAGEAGAAVPYFLEGNVENSGRWAPSVSALFDRKGAIAALNSTYWSKALALTDVLDLMPQKRRNEWHETIQKQKCPEFEEETVRNTLMDLLGMRQQFLAERVDGIFRGLSGEHVTNAPEAFGKRMIIARVLTPYDTVEHSTAGLINDLRAVVAKFMGRDEPGYQASEHLVRQLRGRWGEWVSIDGGALRIRLYKKGTAHMEVHPDMAWRLNQILAHLYPLAIPAQFRERPRRKAKDVPLIQRPLPFQVLSILGSIKPAKQKVNDWPERYTSVRNTVVLSDSHKPGTQALEEARSILASIGGTPVAGSYGWWEFDYDPLDVIQEIVVTGCVPDQRAHQFYPTPAGLAQRVVEMAEIGPEHQCLEPSAGMGGLADFMPKDRTTCVEISGLHRKVLESKGFRVVWGDFLPWADGRVSEGKAFDRIVTNPPFDQGRWAAHIDHAAPLLRPGGRLVAILPSGAKNRDVLPGFRKEWHGPFDNQFPGASVCVVVLVADKDAS
jgi:hypothetical protein